MGCKYEHEMPMITTLNYSLVSTTISQIDPTANVTSVSVTSHHVQDTALNEHAAAKHNPTWASQGESAVSGRLTS